MPVFYYPKKGCCMRDHSKHIELTREEAVSTVLEKLGPDFAWESTGAWPEDTYKKEVVRKRVEMVPLCQAGGRVLAYDQLSRTDVPNCLTCSMDSIAVHWDDFKNGIPDTSDWKRGVHWEFANTGIAMPDGFDTAIVIEHIRVSDDEQSVSIHAAPSAQYAGTRAKGSTISCGDVLARAGEIVNSEIAARIAGGNIASVPVVRKPRVAFIPTGNELTMPGAAFVEYRKNLETNSMVAQAKIEEWGGIYVPFDITLDDPDDIERRVKQACETSDIVVLNAGSSKGSDDWSVEQLESIGEIICHQTNHGPGHHSSFAIVDGTPIVGISGPAGGAAFTMNFYLWPVMMRFLGCSTEPRRIPARLTSAFSSGSRGGGKPQEKKEVPGETRPQEAIGDGSFFSVRPVLLSVSEEGLLEAEPVSGRLGSIKAAHANALYMMPSGTGEEPPAVGDIIYVELR